MNWWEDEKLARRTNAIQLMESGLVFFPVPICSSLCVLHIYNLQTVSRTTPTHWPPPPPLPRSSSSSPPILRPFAFPVHSGPSQQFLVSSLCLLFSFYVLLSSCFFFFGLDLSWHVWLICLLMVSLRFWVVFFFCRNWSGCWLALFVLLVCRACRI